MKASILSRIFGASTEENVSCPTAPKTYTFQISLVLIAPPILSALTEGAPAFLQFCRWNQLAHKREEEELVNGARSEDLADDLELHRV